MNQIATLTHTHNPLPLSQNQGQQPARVPVSSPAAGMNQASSP